MKGILVFRALVSSLPNDAPFIAGCVLWKFSAKRRRGLTFPEKAG
jgi:hypothetical protein